MPMHDASLIVPGRVVVKALAAVGVVAALQLAVDALLTGFYRWSVSRVGRVGEPPR